MKERRHSRHATHPIRIPLLPLFASRGGVSGAWQRGSPISEMTLRLLRMYVATTLRTWLRLHGIIGAHFPILQLSAPALLARGRALPRLPYNGWLLPDNFVTSPEKIETTSARHVASVRIDKAALTRATRPTSVAFFRRSLAINILSRHIDGLSSNSRR